MNKNFSRASRNTLNKNHLPRFPGDNLFDKIGRAVCEAATLPRKELYESWEAAKRIRKVFRGGRIIDCAAGHGLLAHIMLILDNTSPQAICVDKRIPENALHLSQTVITAWPRLENRIEYQEMRIEDFKAEQDDLIVSVHGCGTLTDTVINIAIQAQARVAVLPCCHSTDKCDTGNLEGWMDEALAIDTVRASLLKQAGYRIYTRTIPEDITPKNRLLLAEPKSS